MTNATNLAYKLNNILVDENLDDVIAVLFCALRIAVLSRCEDNPNYAKMMEEQFEQWDDQIIRVLKHHAH